MKGEAMLGKHGDYFTVAASIMGVWLIALSQCNSSLGLWISLRRRM